MRSQKNNSAKLMIVSFILCILLIFCNVFLLWNHQKNRYANDDLTEKSQEIEMQNSQLLLSNSELMEENASLSSQIADLEQENATLSSTITSQNEQILILEDQVRSLEDAAVIASEALEAAEAAAAEAAPMDRIAEYAPGTILSREQVEGHEDDYFQAYSIVPGDAVYNRIIGKSYRENPNISLDDLRYLKMIHYNFNQEIQVGELIVNTRVVDKVIPIFHELFDAHYEIQSMYLIDNYWTGDGGSSDSASIDKNNTSSFCYRTATGSGNLSNHAYGCAIDLNPQQNPYVSSGYCAHPNAYKYMDRNCGDPHVITHGDFCFETFARYGYSWGGDWQGSVKDYQHFEIKLY